MRAEEVARLKDSGNDLAVGGAAWRQPHEVGLVDRAALYQSVVLAGHAVLPA